MTSKRREFDRATRVAIVKRAMRPDGQPACEKCAAIGCRLEVHHVDMDAMQIDKSRKLTALEGVLLCEPCHDAETAKQAPVLAKAKAVEARHLGAHQPKSTIPKRKKPEKPKRDKLTMPPRREMFK